MTKTDTGTTISSFRERAPSFVTDTMGSLRGGLAEDLNRVRREFGGVVEPQPGIERVAVPQREFETALNLDDVREIVRLAQQHRNGLPALNPYRLEN